MTIASAIDVTAGVVLVDGKVLLAKRAQGKHLAGYWEFPGGKVDEEESSEECLAREFEEEFGIEVEIGEFITESVLDYGDKVVRLLAYFARHVSGEIVLKDHDDIAFVRLPAIMDMRLAPADIPIAEVLVRYSAED